MLFISLSQQKSNSLNMWDSKIRVQSFQIVLATEFRAVVARRQFQTPASEIMACSSSPACHAVARLVEDPRCMRAISRLLPAVRPYVHACTRGHLRGGEWPVCLRVPCGAADPAEACPSRWTVRRVACELSGVSDLSGTIRPSDSVGSWTMRDRPSHGGVGDGTGPSGSGPRTRACSRNLVAPAGPPVAVYVGHHLPRDLL
jgi:hypothetical protein